MSRVSRSVRIAIAGLLAISALTVFGVSPASAAATGTLVDNGNGTATVTFSGAASNDNMVLMGLPSGTACTTNVTPAASSWFLTTDLQAPMSAWFSASPQTIAVGTTAYAVSGAGPTTIAAGAYNLCYQNLNTQSGVVITVVQALQVTLGSVTPTTTAAPTTTTAPAADPVAPAFTG